MLRVSSVYPRQGGNERATHVKERIWDTGKTTKGTRVRVQLKLAGNDGHRNPSQEEVNDHHQTHFLSVGKNIHRILVLGVGGSLDRRLLEHPFKPVILI